MGYRVLLWEKDHPSAARTRRMLRRYGFEVDLANPHGVDAPRFLEADCVVAHAQMRSAQSLAKLRRGYPEVPVIIAPLGHMGDEHQELQRDVDDLLYLTAGFIPTSLRDSINYVCESRERVKG